MTILLSAELLAFAEEKAKAEGFADAAAYVADMLEEQRKLERFRTLAREGLASPVAGEVNDAYLARLRAQVRDRA